jgi:copper chaperone CopZ
MEKVVFEVPKMYADHHVERVRKALLPLKGVKNVVASSAAQRVFVEFEPKQLTVSALEEALRAAGYGPGEQWPMPQVSEGKADDSPWWRTTPRVTWTNMKDREMSGDFRKY